MREFMEKSLPKEIKDLDYYRSCHLTIGRLREFLAENQDLDDDALMLVERVHDVYYNEHGWAVVYKKGDMCYMLKKLEAFGEIVTDAELQESMNQYHPAWCITRYADDKKDVYIHLHY